MHTKTITVLIWYPGDPEPDRELHPLVLRLPAGTVRAAPLPDIQKYLQKSFEYGNINKYQQSVYNDVHWILEAVNPDKYSVFIDQDSFSAVLLKGDRKATLLTPHDWSDIEVLEFNTNTRRFREYSIAKNVLEVAGNIRTFLSSGQFSKVENALSGESSTTAQRA